MRSKRLVSSVARKKIVFVIVEGPSDDNTIGYFLYKIFDKNTVHVEVMHCDITTEKGVTSHNIHLKCCEIVKKYAKNNHYKKEHFQQIIHIVDTDGVFVQQDYVTESPEVERTTYTTKNIICKNKIDILERNTQKSSVLNRLISCQYIWTSIPYSVYYMSCNLDHVLYDKPNSTDDEKESDSYKFAKQYKNDLEGFKSYIRESDFSVSGDYQESWAFIKKDCNSLNRYTNLGICFPGSAQLPNSEEN